MEPVRLWAAVEFTAQSGSTDALLGHAAQAGLHLTRIVPLPGGFRARCAAWHYRPLAALARQGHVRLRVEKRLGLFFRLRPLLRRTGLWAGLALFIPLLVQQYKQGKFPIDKLIVRYPLADINQAFADSASGKVIKPVVVM